MKKQEAAKKSVLHYLKVMFPVLSVLLILYLGLNIVCVYLFRTQITDYAETFVDLYVKQIETTISNINYRMIACILDEDDTEESSQKYIDNIKVTNNIAFRNYYANKLRDIFRTYSAEYGKDYQFFAYFPEINLFVGSNCDDGMPQHAWEKYREDIIQKLEGKKLIPNSGSQHWQVVNRGNENVYILKLFYSDGIYMGCWIRPSNLTKPLENAIEGARNTVLLYDDKNDLISDHEAPARSGLSITRTFQTIPFRVELYINDYGFFQLTFLMQLGMVLSGFLVLLFLLFLIYFLYKKIMKPIKKFSSDVARIQRGQMRLEEISSSELFELEQANDKFRQMLGTIKTLQNEVYEMEIEKQKMNMEYLKIQIKPHFYLNCLNFIYNMIHMKKYAEAVSMVFMTAEYMRYLYNNERDRVFMWEEMEHIQQYLNIQKLRFGDAFEFYIDQEKEIEKVLVPPLLIQTFVENCIKYGIDFTSKLQITVTVYSENIGDEPYVNICIVDNGPGFSKELLEKLEDQEQYIENEKERVGISNTLKRLHYLYQNRARVSFYNGPVKGAIVDIHLPIHSRNEGELM